MCEFRLLHLGVFGRQNRMHAQTYSVCAQGWQRRMHQNQNKHKITARRKNPRVCLRFRGTMIKKLHRSSNTLSIGLGRNAGEKKQVKCYDE